ncbi:similar to Saccharomyces cerevisiae YNL071W LAT1 Dihydrolipoamide acetyltransferase component (E2) of pyruvate dehydrogenase complex [Maudiozyma saulgeensis]|uniref:Acetyltransferase component of pyruvate dehydrogenase complex n=1 Tax=Maudiozyma saulgeensis TaxID=1789683 RepID=A0A1X7QZK2_9SACH|nr:similar to Saccharomyces cerevisiae YNL071W LAT1 Dihydrolipoamide acetyltransferase component (E2) of pyruvate dehydrogenase complex [Kazachstania saulgeensis]
MSALLRTVPRFTRTSLVTSQLRLQLRGYASSYPPHTIIGMPALSPTMSQGNLAAWTKKIGDQLAPGEVIAEIETDKAQMDFEFQDDGYLAKILVPEGTKDIPVNKPIAVYVEDAADVPAFKDFTVKDSKSTPASESVKEESGPATKSAPETSPKVAKPDSGSSKKDVSTSTVSHAGRVFASPLAKTLALEHGIALKNVTGTGPNGRIIKNDIEKFLETQQESSSATSSSTGATVTQAAPTPVPTPSVSAAASYEDVPITTMRQIIADRLLQSTNTTPSYIVSSDISVSKLLKLRQSLNATAQEKYKISINDILIKAITVAAKRVPDANSYWLANEKVIRKFKNVDVSVAVATPTGLLTPIVKNAESKGLVEISNEVKELAKRAKINKLAPEEFQGGTICISNLGMNSAVSMFTSIINLPQSTILAIATIKKVAIPDATAEHGFSFDDQVTITGTFDHRTIDGAKGGDFMKELKQVIENPLELLL